MPNLGPVMASRLKAVGVETEGDLRRLGAVAAYLALQRRSRTGLSLSALYAMEAALLGIDWRALPQTAKAELRIAVALADSG